MKKKKKNKLVDFIKTPKYKFIRFKIECGFDFRFHSSYNYEKLQITSSNMIIQKGKSQSWKLKSMDGHQSPSFGIHMLQKSFIRLLSLFFTKKRKKFVFHP